MTRAFHALLATSLGMACGSSRSPLPQDSAAISLSPASSATVASASSTQGASSAMAPPSALSTVTPALDEQLAELRAFFDPLQATTPAGAMFYGPVQTGLSASTLKKRFSFRLGEVEDFQNHWGSRWKTALDLECVACPAELISVDFFDGITSSFSVRRTIALPSGLRADVACERVKGSLAADPRLDVHRCVCTEPQPSTTLPVARQECFPEKEAHLPFDVVKLDRNHGAEASGMVSFTGGALSVLLTVRGPWAKLGH